VQIGLTFVLCCNHSTEAWEQYPETGPGREEEGKTEIKEEKRKTRM
jgi:hypothetical protein